MISSERVLENRLSFSSSLKGDLWTQRVTAKGYDIWYFDALSDDGNDALTIIFYDNFVFSPRYNSKDKIVKTPAVVFSYYKDHKPVYRIACEFNPDEFSSESNNRTVRIGNNNFRYDSAPYGNGFLIQLNLECQQNKYLEARLEWLLIEDDFEQSRNSGPETHDWNLVAPRADVTGHITVRDKKSRISDSIHFRGSGYHDHKADDRFLPATIESWQWGRAHFSDSTAVFCRYKEFGVEDYLTRLYVVRNGELLQKDTLYEPQQFSRDIFGIKYPSRLRFLTDENLGLRVKQNQLLESSYFYLRFLSEMTLTMRDGIPHKTIGITEHLSTKLLGHRWLDWLVDRRISKPSLNKN